MPVKSKAQWNFLQSAAHSSAFAKKNNISRADAKRMLGETPKGAYGKLPTRITPKKKK